MPEYTYVVKDFDKLSLTELYEILLARAEVFLLEQNIVCQDLDRVDNISRHYFFKDGDSIVAYLRAYPVDDCVQIGRVLTVKRGVGLGRELMERALDDITEHYGNRPLMLHSQTHAIGFYQKFGFTVVSDEFMEEGVPHVTMKK